MSLVTQRPDINYLQDIVTNQNYKLITNKQGAAEIMFMVVITYTYKKTRIFVLQEHYFSNILLRRHPRDQE